MMQRKTIIMLSDNSLWSMSNGKGAPSFHNTVKGYCDNGYKVILIQPKYAVNSDLSIENCCIITFKNSLLYKISKMPKIGFFILKYLKLYNYYYYKKMAKEYLKQEKISIIYAYEINGVKAAKSISRKNNVPLITRFQGTILCNKKKTLINQIRYSDHYYALKQKADLCIMTNDGTQGDRVLKELNNESDKILFLRNGVDIPKHEVNENITSEIKKSLEIKSYSLITVSRLVKWKRVDRAIMLVKWLVNYYPDIKLIIVGDGVERINLESLVHNNNLTNNVLFAGSIEHDNVLNYISAADVFLSFYDLSNVGNPLLEAMMLSKPIVTLDVGDTKTIISHNKNGLIYNINDIENIYLGTKMLLDNQEIAKLLGTKAKEYADQNFYNWEQRVKIELEAVENILNT